MLKAHGFLKMIYAELNLISLLKTFYSALFIYYFQNYTLVDCKPHTKPNRS